MKKKEQNKRHPFTRTKLFSSELNFFFEKTTMIWKKKETKVIILCYPIWAFQKNSFKLP